MKRSEIKLIAQAVKKRWPISEEYRTALVQQMIMLVGNPETSDRAKIAATKILTEMEKQNQSDERDKTLNDQRHRLLDVAQRLGIADSVGDTAEVGTSAGDETVAGSKEIDD